MSDGDLPRGAHTRQPAACRVFPTRRFLPIDSLSPMPAAGRRGHPQRLVRAHLVVLLPECLQPARPVFALLRKPSLMQGILQTTVETLYFPLRLRMTDGREMQPNPLLHQPNR